MTGHASARAKHANFQWDARSAPDHCQRAASISGDRRRPARYRPPRAVGPRTDLAPARRGNLGSPRPQAPFHLLEGDGLDRFRPCGPTQTEPTRVVAPVTAVFTRRLPGRTRFPRDRPSRPILLAWLAGGPV